MADKEWRPSDWMNPYHCMDRHIKTKHGIFEAGATAGIKAVIKWLFELCKDHHHFISDEHGSEGEEVLHKDCPSCMRQLKESE